MVQLECHLQTPPPLLTGIHPEKIYVQLLTCNHHQKSEVWKEFTKQERWRDRHELLLSTLSSSYMTHIKLLSVCLSLLRPPHMIGCTVCVCYLCVFVLLPLSVSAWPPQLYQTCVYFPCVSVSNCVMLRSEGMKESIFCRHSTQANYSS